MQDHLKNKIKKSLSADVLQSHGQLQLRFFDRLIKGGVEREAAFGCDVVRAIRERFGATSSTFDPDAFKLREDCPDYYYQLAGEIAELINNDPDLFIEAHSNLSLDREKIAALLDEDALLRQTDPETGWKYKEVVDGVQAYEIAREQFNAPLSESSVSTTLSPELLSQVEKIQIALGEVEARDRYEKIGEWKHDMNNKLAAFIPTLMLPF